MKLIIEDDEGRRTIVPFLGDALNIGRADENQVRLGEKNVSRKHGRIVRSNGSFVVEDFSTFTGIRVNGEKIHGKQQVKEGDLIQISEFDLQLQAAPDELAKADDANSLLDGVEEVTAVPSPEEQAARRREETAIIKREDVLPPKTPEVPAIPVAEQPKLVGVNGTRRGVEFPLTRSPISIGRALENDVCLDHPQVSRSHCRLALVSNSWKVIDAESRHGVKVNGEPYAASPLHHGDVLEVGPVHLMFALPGKPLILPAEAASSSPGVDATIAANPVVAEELAPAAKGPGSKIAVGVGVVVIGLAAAVLLFGHQRAEKNELPDAADAALQRAGTSAAAHRYREATRALQAAIAAGAPPEKTRVLPSLETEARAEEQYQQLVQAIARGDFDAARSLLDLLATVPTFYGGRALEHSQEVKGGYVKLHVDRANAAHGRDDAACLTEANLALSVNPQSDAARALASECAATTSPAPTASATPAPAKPIAAQAPSKPARSVATTALPSAPVVAPPPPPPPVESAPLEPAPLEPPPAEPPGPAPAPTAAATTAPAPAAAIPAAKAAPTADEEARRLLRQGNAEATAGDYTTAIADFERALVLKPSALVIGGLYRSLGATHSRAGNADQGARYYRLYLPYCDNPTEKAFLQKTLDDYDASRGQK